MFHPDSLVYFPGQLYMESSIATISIRQRLFFTDKNHALLLCQSDEEIDWFFEGSIWGEDYKNEVINQSLVIYLPRGEVAAVTFEKDAEIMLTSSVYKASFSKLARHHIAVFSFFNKQEELQQGLEKAEALLGQSQHLQEQHAQRWNTYLERILRTDMPASYNQIAVKAMVTLLSNWRSSKGDLLHDGMVPSHAVGYFVGFWAWDSWRFSAGTAKFDPELAKNNIRAMFDYQQPDGMIIDCIYTDPSENNARDSKPPLVCWAVDEIFTHTGDTAFVAEMYPQLLSYYKWWYEKRDHNRNGMCEYGATDGTLEAAAWESGMDNAIRFDGAVMLKNEGYEDAWSMDQESVDLNAYLALECKLLKKFSSLLKIPFDAPDYSSQVADYFFDKNINFFCDRRLKDGSFIEEPGCEAYTPLWTRIATQAQVDSMLPMLQDTAKFSTYIPFPTIAADNPKYNPRGYWRGPIWLDQTYFAIRGLRNYGYNQLADEYTLQVFDRLSGLKEGAPIHENYGTHTGERLKAPHFSWSSSHLLMMYDDYGK